MRYLLYLMLLVVSVSGASELTEAILHGDVDLARKLIKERPELLEVRGDDEDHLGPLGYAAALGQVEVVQALLAAGADIEATDANRRPLWITAELAARIARASRRELEEFPPVFLTWLPWAELDADRVRQCLDLLKSTAEKKRQAAWESPLFEAIRQKDLEAVKAALAAGADADTVGPEGQSAVHLAAELGEYEVVKVLLAAGADPYRSVAGVSAADLIYKKDQRFGRWILYNVRQEEWRRTPQLPFGAELPPAPLAEALREGNFDLARKLIKEQPAWVNARYGDDWTGMVPLAYAAAQGQVAIVEDLLKAGADVELTDTRHQCTWWAADLVLLALAPDAAADVKAAVEFALPWVDLDTVSVEDVRKCRELLWARAQKQREEAWKSALFVAVREGELADVERALADGAKASAVGPDGKTAIYLAAERGREDMVKVLVLAGGDPYRRPDSRTTMVDRFISPELRKWIAETKPNWRPWQ